MPVDQPSFIWGFVLGFISAGVIGSALQNIRKARGAMAAPDKPMNVPTSGTPRSVMQQAAAAFRRMLLWTVVLLAAAGGTIFLFYVLFS